MAEHQQAVARIIGADPNVDAYMSSIGASGPNATANSGRVFVRLKPRSERTLSADEVIEELRPKLAQVPGIRAFVQNPPPIRIGGTLTKSLYQFTLQGPDTDELYRVAPQLEQRLQALPGLQDVTSDLQIRNPELDVEVDRDRAVALGVTAQQVEDALFTALRHAPGVDDLRAHRPVPRDHGAAARRPARPRPPSRSSTSAPRTAASCPWKSRRSWCPEWASPP